MISAILMILGGFLVIGLIIVANAYFVAQEFSYMSVDRMQLRALAAEGDKRAARALKITHQTSFMLSGAQLGITVTGLLIGYIAEPLVGQGLGILLGDVGIPTGVSVAIGTVSALLISTVASMLFAELFPKNYTIAAPMKTALWLSTPTMWYLRIFGWLIHFFEYSSNAILKLFRIEPVEDLDSSATTDDLESIVDASHEAGELDEDTYMVLDRLLDFPDHDVEHAMIPRSRVDVIAPETTIGEVREMMSTEHTRYPVIDDEHNPIGVVHLFDVLRNKKPDATAATEIMQTPLVVPELMPLPDVVVELRDAGEKMACVIDEYGGFVGIVTMEDLAEEILGDVTDEHDIEETEEITEQDDSHWIVDGDTPIDEIERAVGHDLPDGDYETISGLLISESGALPEEGDEYKIALEAEPEDWVDADEAPHRFLLARVKEVDRHVPSSLSLELVEEYPDGHTSDDDDAAQGRNHDSHHSADADADASKEADK
ncbi:hemolysin family protein [Corynebacterium flavescens]|uniref:Membrane protein n=1 Tax=Corynebacterium flavescens TaxID=28028 RepID=A0A1L7CNA4_CORFL|nr:hemolysin family protein [Corynebacterium flavescens]APT87309.1 membrane protein [Corynebacterium flavescens]KAA8721072.1 HlyC/CorC family transporter [Corynebacterium flavescens]MDN6098752.1 hemolysin family protein [Corynebacterium flavescens]MDN6198816.1 hemolysin family protein [Corynebacterium flavescens]MDN6225673.1 hemolysin family protein [Corynebacterium flavescens]